MSSFYVRDQIKTFVAANFPSETALDLTSLYDELQDFLEENSVAPDSPWLGIQFIGYDEIPVTLVSGNTTGKYRETGGIYFHIVDVAKLGGAGSILTRGEALRDLMRGQRIGRILIESVSPLNFDSGATLRFEGGFMSASFIASYEYDNDLVP